MLDVFLLISVKLAVLQWFLLFHIIRWPFLRELSSLRFGLLASAASAAVNEYKIVGTTSGAWTHRVLLVCKVRTLVLISSLVLLLIRTKSCNLSLGSCNFIVLVYENHLFSLMFTLQNGGVTAVSLGTFEVSLVLAHGTTSWRSGGCAAGVLLLLLLNHDVTLRFEMLAKLTASSSCLVAQELVSFLLVRLVAGVVVAGQVWSQVSWMGSWSFLGGVAQREIVLGSLLPIVEGSCGIHWNYSFSGAALGPQTFVTVWDGTSNNLLGGSSMWVLTCDQSRRMLKSRTWVNTKHLLRPWPNNRCFRFTMRRLAQVMFERSIA